MSRGDIIGGAAVPLTDALPWDVPAAHRTLVVNDSIGTDGRFLLYTLASQVLSSCTISKGRVLWLGCGPATEPQILQGMKKIGCDRSVISHASLWSNRKASDESEDGKEQIKSGLTIRSVTTEVGMQLRNMNAELNEQSYLNEVYRDIQAWLGNAEHESAPTWIIVDDVSALSHLLGNRLVYNFLLMLNSKSHGKFGVLVRCSNDAEEESLPTLAGSSVATGPNWFGAGGLGPKGGIQATSPIPWERSLIEIADGMMDVLPLTSGYTRELHGRIVFTRVPGGRGWGNRENKPQNKLHSPSQIINYCISDSKIVAYIL